MIRTPVCDLLGLEHPIALGGMGPIYSPELVAAVSNAGGLGALGCHYLSPERIRAATAAIRERTNKAFALNFLIFDMRRRQLRRGTRATASGDALAWPRADQDLKSFIDRAHEAGCKVTFMVSGVPDAVRAAHAGADVIIAQGTEGGGHVGWQATMALVPMVVDAVAPIPVLAAGGIADGRGLAAALALGADGVLLGTRFLASEESTLHANFKQAILDSDGHDTLLSEIPDIAAGLVWPGAMSRSRRNRFIERWAGREWALRQQRADALAGVQAARKSGDTDEATLSMGQDAGLIHDILPAGEIVRRIAREAEQILAETAAAIGRPLSRRDPAVAGRGHSSMASCNGHRRNAGLAEIPEQSRHRAEPLAHDRRQHVLVGRVLRASGIGMRHPDRAQAEHVGEGVVGQRSAEIGDDGRARARSCARSSAPPSRPRDPSGSSRLALKNPRSPRRTSTWAKPWRSRWRRSAGMMSSTSVPTT